MQFQNKFDDVSDHNKYPSSEKEDEECSYRISYFDGIKPTYRTSSAETCTKIAFEIEDDQCQRACHYHGHLKCQECIEENLPDQCSELSGAKALKSSK